MNDHGELDQLQACSRSSRRHSSQESDHTERNTSSRAKNALVSLWNNMKYGFHYKPRSKYNFDVPICLLGQIYQSKINGSIESIERRRLDAHVETLFLSDVLSRVHLTYRHRFEQMLGTHHTSDSGWGCMLRSGQMILAQGLLMHFLGRTWRWKRLSTDSTSPNHEKEDRMHRTIVRWFADVHTDSPFSIHELVRRGRGFDKQPGDWFGPSLVSVLLKCALDEASIDVPLLNNIVCYVSQDCAVYLQDLLQLCTSQDGRLRSAIILVPLRLGAQTFNTAYSEYLKQLLCMPSCLGVIGGKPRHSLYFIGYQQDKLLALDPHHSQRSVDMSMESFSLESYHTTNIRKVALHAIDPSCAIGFYLRDQHALDEFRLTIDMYTQRATSAGDYPIFTLVPEGNCFTHLHADVSQAAIEQVRLRSPSTHPLDTSDDFVLL